MKRIFQVLTVVIALLSIVQTVTSSHQAQAQDKGKSRGGDGPVSPNI